MAEAQYAYLSGPIANVNESAPYRAGMLGKTLRVNGRTYQYVQMDSGAATPTPAVNLTCHWKTKASYIVTTKLSDSNINQPAGVCPSAITAGNYFWMIIKGTAVTIGANVVAAGAAGDWAITKAGGTAGEVDRTAIGTAAVSKPWGVFTAAASATGTGATVVVDLDLSLTDEA